MKHLAVSFRILVKLIKIVWASPNTLLGLLIGGFGFLFGAKVLFNGGAIEFHGGLVGRFLRLFPIRPAAMTIGHTILGQTIGNLEISREHEMVHVRQYERWGIFFLPMYGFWSLWMWLYGKHAYFDNPFEVEAYTATDPDFYRRREQNAG